jgi:hypothetical protein
MSDESVVLQNMQSTLKRLMLILAARPTLPHYLRYLVRDMCSRYDQLDTREELDSQ